MEDSAGSRRVLPTTVSCRLGRATAEREQPEDRGFRRWRHRVDDLGRRAFAVPVADLGDRGHVDGMVELTIAPAAQSMDGPASR